MQNDIGELVYSEFKKILKKHPELKPMKGQDKADFLIVPYIILMAEKLGYGEEFTLRYMVAAAKKLKLGNLEYQARFARRSISDNYGMLEKLYHHPKKGAQYMLPENKKELMLVSEWYRLRKKGTITKARKPAERNPALFTRNDYCVYYKSAGSEDCEYSAIPKQGIEIIVAFVPKRQSNQIPTTPKKLLCIYSEDNIKEYRRIHKRRKPAYFIVHKEIFEDFMKDAANDFLVNRFTNESR